METQSYADEILMAGWTEVPGWPADAGRQALPRLAERIEERPAKPSPFCDPEFIARVYRAQR